jgi:flavodoxin
MNILTVYYSRSGNTKKVAETISNTIGGDLEEITESRSRAGPLGFLLSGREAQGEITSTINSLKYDPSNYDLLIIGTPIWAGKISSPVRTYLKKVVGKTNKVAYFATRA